MNESPALTINDLEAGRIDADTFDHQNHVYLAWLYLEAYPVTEAIERFSAALKRLTLKLGVPGKYHETITWFYMLIIASRRSQHVAATWPEFCSKNADIVTKENNVLSRYYSKQTLASEQARRNFIMPDRIAA